MHEFRVHATLFVKYVLRNVMFVWLKQHLINKKFLNVFYSNGRNTNQIYKTQKLSNLKITFLTRIYILPL